MSISTIQNFYKETITRAVTLTGATNIYVSALPTPSEGYVVISPSSSSLREIVYYTAKGTDSNGTYLTVTLANRGLGGTTAQTHAIGEPVRMNVTAEHIKEISDALDQIAAAGAQDASTVTKGITKLSVAPVSATEPIAVGDNDPRVPSENIDFVTSAGTGDGSDGDVTISSPTTLTKDMFYNNLVVNSTLTTNGYKIFVKDTLSGSGIIQCNGGNGGNASGATGGTAGSAAASGTLSTIAGVAGKNASKNGAHGVAGNTGLSIADSSISTANDPGAGGNSGGVTSFGNGATGGSGGTKVAYLTRFFAFLWQLISALDITATGATIKLKGSASGGGGASGGAGNGSASYGGGGGGSGAPGGIVWIMAKIFGGSVTIKALGGNGGNGGNATSSGGGGGGGAAGNGGVAVVGYYQKTWTGSYELTAGTAGALGSGTGGGTNGTAGASANNGNYYEIDLKTL